MSAPGLLLIDLQKDFFDSQSGVGHIEKAVGIPAVRHLLTLARRLRWPIFHIITSHSSSSQSLPPHLYRSGVKPYCVENTEGAEIIEGLYEEGEPIIVKRSYSAFRSTNLNDVLKDVSTLIISGIASDCCILQTAHDAAELGKEVFVPYQAIGASSEGDYVFGLTTLAKNFGSVVDVRSLLTSCSPAREQSIPKGRINVTLSDWYQSQVEALSLVPILIDLPVESAVRLLEQKVASTFLA